MTGQPSDPTFTRYTAAQATKYASNRSGYSDSLCDYILSFHDRTGGKRTALLDVGCGPGNSTRTLAAHFTHATGIDPSPSMIAAATQSGATTATGAAVEWAVSAAEQVDAAAGVRRADLLTAGTAAHWFDMPAFWAAAARAVAPGGTVALWTAAGLYAHPRRTPGAAAVQAALTELELRVLAPYELPGNALSRTLYAGLGTPWGVEPRVAAFPEGLFERHVWNGDGDVSDGEDFFGGSREVSLRQLEDSLGTASMVTRWREAHPDLAGTEQSDCVKVTMRAVQRAMGAEGQSLDDVKLYVGNATVLLLFKRTED